MKGEYVEEKDHPNAMFAKLKFQPPLPSSSHPHPHHHFQLTTTDQTDHQHHSPTTPTTTANREANSSDGATIEAIRRPRGRPPGSKNKPKPPVFITREPDPSMSPYFLEIPTNADVVVSITKFCRKHSTGLTVLSGSGSGSVANVTLRQPTTPGATVTFHGRFDLLSLSATILPPNSTTPSIGNGFSITLAGPQGQVIGGSVVGPLFAAGTVYVVAASFNSPSFHRLPVGEVEEERESSAVGKEIELSSPVGSTGGGGGGGERGDAGVETCGMSVYSGGCQVGSDVIWAPTARQPPPSSHYG